MVCAEITVFAITSLLLSFSSVLFFCSSGLLVFWSSVLLGGVSRRGARPLASRFTQRQGSWKLLGPKGSSSLLLGGRIRDHGSRHRYRCPPSRARRSQSVYTTNWRRPSCRRCASRSSHSSSSLCSAYPNTQTVPPQPLPASAASGKCSCFFRARGRGPSQLRVSTTCRQTRQQRSPQSHAL